MAFGERETNTKFIKIDGEADIAIVGEEVSGLVSFSNNRYVADRDGAFRFAVNVFDGKRVRALEGGAGLYKSIGKVIKEKGSEVMIRVTKTGSGKETRWSATYLRDLTDEDRAAIGECERVDLARAFPWSAAPANLGDDDIPF